MSGNEKTNQEVAFEDSQDLIKGNMLDDNVDVQNNKKDTINSEKIRYEHADDIYK
jgi:hypothetical protein